MSQPGRFLLIERPDGTFRVRRGLSAQEVAAVGDILAMEWDEPDPEAIRAVLDVPFELPPPPPVESGIPAAAVAERKAKRVYEEGPMFVGRE